MGRRLLASRLAHVKIRCFSFWAANLCRIPYPERNQNQSNSRSHKGANMNFTIERGLSASVAAARLTPVIA